MKHESYCKFTHSGAKNVINACRECKVKRLIYNSSADVVSNRLHDIDNGDESLPYATKVRLFIYSFLFVPLIAYLLFCASFHSPNAVCISVDACTFIKFDMLTDLYIQAEALVLYANDIDGLLTCALRPCNVFGPGDMRIIPFLVKGAKFGWAKV